MKNRLTPIIGAIVHTTSWLNASRQDSFINNPNFIADSKDQKTIYCIHGTADRDASFRFIASRLINNLPGNIKGIRMVAFDDRAKGTSIEEYAKQLKNKILQNKDDAVILMGHSRGSLVASWFAEYLAAANKIKVESIVSICGPFKGSVLATPLKWLSASVNEMSPNSNFLHELSTKVRKSEVDYLFIGCKKDHLVSQHDFYPYGTQLENLKFYLNKYHGHLSIMTCDDAIPIIQHHVTYHGRQESKVKPTI